MLYALQGIYSIFILFILCYKELSYNKQNLMLNKEKKRQAINEGRE